ncbi:hypothetical protein EIP91_010049 [Steccherinum ochraceum]|uniref:Carboxymuconolactone decarboxylase-like domain-containing protein n=1 Tax=Steccherinum ochraceum TaxID=92696 RepID=A0A4R0R6C2_9APHY|nr:hypothetical protein EIP91_010049 [Steccherinum ochraceum]
MLWPHANAMAQIASVEYLTQLKLLFPGSRSALNNPWYLVASVAFSASNRPEGVPAVFRYALDELQREQARRASEDVEVLKEQLQLARRSRDCLLQSGLLSGYSRSINGLVALHEAMPTELRDTKTLRDIEKPIQDFAKDGRTLYRAMYGDNADRVQALLDDIYPDMGLYSTRLLVPARADRIQTGWFSNTIGYGVVYGGADVLTQVESSFVIATANIAMGTPRQIAWHLKNAMNGGATLEEVQAVQVNCREESESATVKIYDEKNVNVEIIGLFIAFFRTLERRGMSIDQNDFMDLR